MRRDQIQIPEPCHADWEQMRGDDAKRFCDSCTKHVHNLSELTRDEAKTLLAEGGEHLCVQYAFDTDGEVMFRDSQHPAWRLKRQMDGAKRLIAAALTLPLLAACDTPDTPHDPSAVSPIQISSDGTLLNADPGAGLAPVMPVEPPPTPSIDIEQGEFAPEDDAAQHAAPGAGLAPTMQVSPSSDTQDAPADDTHHLVRGEYMPEDLKGTTPEDEPSCEGGSEQEANTVTRPITKEVVPPVKQPIRHLMGKPARSGVTTTSDPLEGG